MFKVIKKDLLSLAKKDANGSIVGIDYMYFPIREV